MFKFALRAWPGVTGITRVLLGVAFIAAAGGDFSSTTTMTLAYAVTVIVTMYFTGQVLIAVGAF